MRGIPEKLLNKKYASLTNEVCLFNAGKHEMLKELMQECQELNPWMTLDEFLKSGFEGLCWVYSVYEGIFVVQFIDDNFISINTGAKAQLKYIERVQPIHKPEPPR